MNSRCGMWQPTHPALALTGQRVCSGFRPWQERQVFP